MNRLFLRQKPCKVLVILKESQTPRYISALAKESGATYVHTTKLLRKLETFNIVTFEKSGKKKMVKLTESGMRIATLLSELMLQLAEKAKSVSHQPQQS
ncbi:MAG: hypothetical protein QW590_02240 [Candidatus Bilamarchaeaceae archaeon]